MIPTYILSPFREVTRIELHALEERVSFVEETDYARWFHANTLEEQLARLEAKVYQLQSILRRSMLINIDIVRVLNKEKETIDEDNFNQLLLAFQNLSIN